jgi:hypothetical protein
MSVTCIVVRVFAGEETEVGRMFGSVCTDCHGTLFPPFRAACQVMSVVSSQWCLNALVDIAEHSSNVDLTRFLRRVFEHVEQLGWTQRGYHNAKERYCKRAAVENIWKSPVENVKETYEAELAKLPGFHPTATT